MESRELELGLSGRTLVFGDREPFCLVCGRRPYGTRTVGFKDVQYAERETQAVNVFLRFIHPLLAYLNRARHVSFEVEAPLCFRHFWRGREGELAVTGLLVAGGTVLAVLAWQGRLPAGSSGTGSFIKGALVGLLVLGAWLAWRRGKGRAILPCQARRESRDRVVLTYDGDAPGGPRGGSS